MSITDKNRHIDQGIPIEWEGFRHRGETLVAHDVPEGSVVLYRVLGATRNARVLAQAEGALWEGNLVHPYYDQVYRSVSLQHSFGGKMGRVRVDEWLDDPVPVLEVCKDDDLSRFDTKSDGGPE